MAEQTAEPYWAVCRTFSFRVHRVMREIEKTNHGTFLPTYARVWSSRGKLSARERVLFPGYLFFQTVGDKWAAVRDVDGVHSVLTHGERADEVKPHEMARMVIDHAMRAHDEVSGEGLERVANTKRKKGRRPRASKRARVAA